MTPKGEQAKQWADVVRKMLPLCRKDCDTLDDLEAFLRGLAEETPLEALGREYSIDLGKPKP